MTGFVAMRWSIASLPADAEARRLLQVFEAAGWRLAIGTSGWSVLISATTSIEHLRGAQGSSEVIVGNLFDRRATEQSRAAPGAVPEDTAHFADFCSALTTNCWGAYVALGIKADAPDRLSLYRDPMGMMECVTWRCGGVRIATSAPEAILPLAPPGNLAVRWDVLASLIRFPGRAGEEIPLYGVVALDGGTLLMLDGGKQEVTRLWSPSQSVRQPLRHRRSAREWLPDLIDATLAAWAHTSSNAIAELSGGLDSAIVAAGLVRSRPRANVHWLNFYTSDPQGDERRYARDVAQRLALSLDEVGVLERSVDAALVDDIPVGLRPSVGSLSLFHDRDLAVRGNALGATRLYTGHGGDALFYQYATPLLAGDIWRNQGSLRDKLSTTQEFARWTGTSVWAVGRIALGAIVRAAPLPEPTFPLDLVNSSIASPARRIPWLDEARDLPSTKQMHILQITAARAAFAPTWTNRALDVVHPLLSQPIVEHALSLSALELTQGKCDRALVRQAYAHRLPASLIERRGKGSITAYYGRMLARSVPFLRAYLLDGTLMAHNVLTRPAVERVLDKDVIMLTNCYAEIFALLFAERWARKWTGMTLD